MRTHNEAQAGKAKDKLDTRSKKKKIKLIAVLQSVLQGPDEIENARCVLMTVVLRTATRRAAFARARPRRMRIRRVSKTKSRR